MKTLAVISRKGGAGKTTVAVNLALSAHRRGARVMVVDSDPQRSASLCLRSRRADPVAVIEANAGKLFQVVTAARRDGYDLIVIDTPAHPEADVAQAANLADLCVAICRPTFLDVASVVQSAEMIRRLGRRGAVAINQAPPPRGAAEGAAVGRPKRWPSSVCPASGHSAPASPISGRSLVGSGPTRAARQSRATRFFGCGRRCCASLSRPEPRAMAPASRRWRHERAA